MCYLVLCEAGFPKKLAFAYLEDLHSEFDEQHGKKVPTVSRPYSFIEFGKVPLPVARETSCWKGEAATGFSAACPMELTVPILLGTRDTGVLSRRIEKW